MNVIVIADSHVAAACKTKGIQPECTVDFIDRLATISSDDVALIYLLSESNLPADLPRLLTLNCPLIINAVHTTLETLPPKTCRINGWAGFFEREVIEAACHDTHKATFAAIFETLGWQYLFVKDIAGFVAARTVAMIINEAYFAASEQIASKADVDVAMKLGTNYPFGPFEWATKIGVKEVRSLLNVLGKQEGRYSIAPLLEKESMY